MGFEKIFKRIVDYDYQMTGKNIGQVFIKIYRGIFVHHGWVPITKMETKLVDGFAGITRVRVGDPRLGAWEKVMV